MVKPFNFKENDKAQAVDNQARLLSHSAGAVERLHEPVFRRPMREYTAGGKVRVPDKPTAASDPTVALNRSKYDTAPTTQHHGYANPRRAPKGINYISI